MPNDEIKRGINHQVPTELQESFPVPDLIPGI